MGGIKMKSFRGIVCIRIGVLLLLAMSMAFAAQTSATLITDRAAFEKDAYYVDKFFNKTFTFKLESDEIMVRFDKSGTAIDSAKLESTYGLSVIHTLNPYYRHIHYRIPGGSEILGLCRSISREKGILSAFPVLRGSDGFPKPVIGHELTVRFKSSLTEQECLKAILGMGSEITEDHWTPGYYTVTVPASMTLFEAIRAYNALDEVRFAEFSLIGFDDKTWIPNDPMFTDQQHLNNTGQVASCACPPYDSHDLRAVPGWDQTIGIPEVVVAVIDTGADLNHPDLLANILDRGSEDWDFADPSDSVPEDEDGHGTSTSGLLAAVANNSIGVSGVAPGCKVMPLRIDLSTGQNQNRADAINYAASQRPLHQGMVMSNSWRMSSGSFTAVYDAIQNAKATGSVVVFAAGNEDQSPVEVPGDSEHCICVVALSPCDERKSTSSCDGESFWGSSYGDAADVSAPGVLIHTTAMGDSYTDTFNGTSSACPQVAGVCALILSRSPGLTPEEVQTILQDGCDDLGTPGWDNLTGYGRVNIESSLNLVKGISLNQAYYVCSSVAAIEVRDDAASGSVSVSVSSATEPAGETVILPESAEAGVFTGSIVISDTAPSSGDSIISVIHGDTITADYSPLADTDTAIIDCEAPIISDVTVTAITHNSALVSWTTDELSDSRVHYGIGAPDQIASLSGRISSHDVLLTGLESCRRSYRDKRLWIQSERCVSGRYGSLLSDDAGF
jgi:hypothetical protein